MRRGAYSMAELEKLVALQRAGQGNPLETGQDGYSPETSQDAPPATPNLRQQIYAVLEQENRWMTRAEICHKVGRVKASWFGALLDAMAQEGYLIRYQQDSNRLLPTFYYRIRKGSE